MVLLVDTREKPDVIKVLRILGIPFMMQKLDYGDFESEHCIFERKTVNDFIQSMRGWQDQRQGGRLWDQLDGLYDICEKKGKIPFLAISGDYAELQTQVQEYGVNLNVNAVFGAIASAVVRYSMNVIHCRGDAELLFTINKIAEKVAEGKLGVPLRQSLRNTHTSKRVMQIANCCRVSPRIAEELDKKFGGLRGVLLATEQQLMLIPGMGPATVARVKAILGDVKR